MKILWPILRGKTVAEAYFSEDGIEIHNIRFTDGSILFLKSELIDGRNKDSGFVVKWSYGEYTGKDKG